MAAAGGPGASAAPRGKPSLRAAFVVFRYRNYRNLWLSSLFAFMGMQMLQVARALLAWDLTHSFAAIGQVSFSFGLPMLLFSLLGGAVADRLDKRNLSLLTNTGVALLAGITAVLVYTDRITFEILLMTGVVQGTLSALGMPARMPLMGDAVGPENMGSAIAMSNTAMNATRLIGPFLAGVIAGVWGVEWAYASQAVAYALASVTMLTVPSGLGSSQSRRATQGGVLVEIGRGLSYVGRDRVLRLLVGMMFISTFFAMPYALLLAGFVQRDLGHGAREYGNLLAATGLGALVGSLAVATIAEFDRKPLLQWAFGILSGVGLIALSVGSMQFGFVGALVSAAALGFVLTAYQTLNSTMVMEATQPQFYGRVMSINMLTFSAMPLMAYPLGEIADRIGAPALFNVQGALVVVAILIVGVLNASYTFGRYTRVTHGTTHGAAPEGEAPESARPGFHGGASRAASQTSQGE